MRSMLKLAILWTMLVSCSCYKRVHIQMPVADIDKKDTYMCFISPMDDYEGQSMVGYEIDSVKDVTHHASVVACEGVNSDNTYWDCTSQQGSISKGRAISLQGSDGEEHVREDFPEGVGIELGPKAKINYIMLQIHYRHPFKVSPQDVPSANITLLLTEERMKYTRQALLMASDGHIPANTERFSSELIMQWSGITIEADTYNIHTHDYGIKVEAYTITNGVMSLIGRETPDPHGTSTFKMANGTTLRVSPGDIIAARCVYNNPLNRTINFGTSHDDEMCNFSLNFRYPTEAAMTYPRTVFRLQDPHKITWCQNDVYTSQTLCETSKNMFK